MKSRTPPPRQIPEPVEIELIRSLFLAFVPSAIMSAGFMASGIVILMQSWDAALLALLVGGSIASVARLVVAWKLAPAAARKTLSLAQAHRLERGFAIPYLGFALMLGLFGLRALMLPDPEVHMLVMCLLFAYCAGVAVGMGMRLWIAVPAMLVSMGPAIIAGLLRQDLTYGVASIFTTAIIGGGIHSLRARHERSVKDIGLRFAFANLARKDALTTLPNRIALREWYEERVALGNPDGLIAVHYIDLNGFKPVNDTHGHPVGDALLIMVGKRIARVIRENDIAARLGGDEFAVIQYGIQQADEAGRLAARLSEAIARPFRIGPRTIGISTGLGYVVADGRDEDLEHLLSLADQALYASKRADGAIMQYEVVEEIRRRHVA
jgi:diguanylate cyclase (GGDEF)-like protein